MQLRNGRNQQPRTTRGTAQKIAADWARVPWWDNDSTEEPITSDHEEADQLGEDAGSSDKKRTIESLPAEIILSIIEYIGYSQCLPLKLAGSRHILSIMRNHPCPSRAEFIADLEYRSAALIPAVLQFHSLLAAAAGGHIALVLSLFHDRPQVLHIPMATQALRYAAEYGQTEVVEVLLHEGAEATLNEFAITPLDPSFNKEWKVTKLKPSRTSVTAIHVAAKSAHIRTVQVLLQHATKRGPGQRTASLVDRYRGALPVQEWEGAMVPAISNGDIEIVKLLLEYGASANISLESGGTGMSLRHSREPDMSLLQYAITWDNDEVVSLLLQKGADVHWQDRSGCTPLHYAVVGRNKVIIAALIKNGADPSVRNWQGETPLCRAIWNGWEDVVRLISPKGLGKDTYER